MKLGLHEQDLDLCDGGSLLALNDFVTHLNGASNMELSLVEREYERKVTLLFLIAS